MPLTASTWVIGVAPASKVLKLLPPCVSDATTDRKRVGDDAGRTVLIERNLWPDAVDDHGGGNFTAIAHSISHTQGDGIDVGRVTDTIWEEIVERPAILAGRTRGDGGALPTVAQDQTVAALHAHFHGGWHKTTASINIPADRRLVGDTIEGEHETPFGVAFTISRIAGQVERKVRRFAIGQHATRLGQTVGSLEGETLGALVQGQALRRMGRTPEAQPLLE